MSLSVAQETLRPTAVRTDKNTGGHTGSRVGEGGTHWPKTFAFFAFALRLVVRATCCDLVFFFFSCS